MGKGSVRRPTNQAQYNDNWESIFGEKDQTEMDFRPDGEGKRPKS
jgi:hypothetical protein